VNEKEYGNGMTGMGGNDNTLYFPISHPEQPSKPIRSICTIGKKTGIGEKYDPI